MQLLQLNLVNFRSWKELSFEPVMGLNVFCGGNAQGKTNLLESIFFLATGKSFRTHRDGELAHRGSSSFGVGGRILTAAGEFQLAVAWNKQEGKSFTLNRQQQSRFADLLGHLPAVAFAPEDLSLIKGGPQQRRQALNFLLLQTDRSYYFYLREYNRVLAQRNMHLKTASPSPGNELLLLGWDEQLAQAGVELMVRRQQALMALAPWVEKYNYRLGNKKALAVHYRPHIRLQPGFNFTQAQEQFIQLLAQNRRQEWRRRLTLTGPQRDEILITLADQEIRSFGSQGEQRLATLAWKLAEARYIKKRSGQDPLLLLDDVYSELDNRRRRFLTAEIGDPNQAFVTTTEPKENLPGIAAAVWEVALGSIKRLR
ncbi:MAG TPA: DNA replication/repair protein RecF [bacterium]|nr:DNA replication/repair protein RecF [bacterium]